MISVLLIGTCDTKADELLFLKSRIEKEGAAAAIMDVGCGTAPFEPAYTNAEVALEAGTTIEAVCKLRDENQAMMKMAEGAAKLTRSLYQTGKLQGMIAIGGTMATDLALDVASVLPFGAPKCIVSTISFSHLLPPHRIPADLMMMLWSGGLYGLNRICESVLSQAAGAVTGAIRASMRARADRPLIGITSLGKSCLSYMLALKPALETRGYEVAVFHSTGMGGRAFESLAAEGRFAAVLDLCLQEISNDVAESVVTAGASRLEAAGCAGIPQIVAPGATDTVDCQAWKEVDSRYHGRPFHTHNRLIASITTPAEDRKKVARLVGEKLSISKGPVKFILPLRGVEEWDRPGGPLHDPDALDAFVCAARASIRPPAELVEIDAHINDGAFAQLVLRIFDDWTAQGIVPPGINNYQMKRRAT